MTGPRTRLTLTMLGVLLFSDLSAQSVSDLTAVVRELSDALANSSITAESDSLLSQFGHVGAGLAADQAKDLLAEFAANTAAANLPAQLEGIRADAQQAKAAVAGINADLPETPDFSHLDYCAQADASSSQIARIEQTINDLNALVQDAEAFKRTLVSVDQLSPALGALFGKLMALDPVMQGTSAGAFSEKWMFFTESANTGGDGAPSAAYLSSHARQDWDAVEKQANDKAQKLRTVLDARKAFHQHFYSVAEQKCADDRAQQAALASLGGAPSFMPSTGSGANTTPDACQTAGRQAGAVAASCMGQTHASMCATYIATARCYSLAATQCGACGTCSSQLQSAAAQARASAQQICAN